MIELTSGQVSVILATVAALVWLIRLEGRLNAEIEIRNAEKHHATELRSVEKRNVTELEGRIMAILREIKGDTLRIEQKLDGKQDKHESH